MMKIVYYSQTCFLDHVLCQVRTLSRLAELSLFIELSPQLWKNNLMDTASMPLTPGVIPADPVLESCFPEGVRQYWRDCANVFLVLHNCPRTVHPSTWRVSHEAAQFILSLKPDVLHFDGVSTRMASAMIELRKIPSVLTIHDPTLHSGEFDWRVLIARWLAFRYTDRFVLHSNGLKGSLAERYGIPPARIDVVPLGALDVFREWMDTPIHTGGRKDTVLFFGRLATYKGLEVLYEAAPMVIERVPNLRIIVAGQPERGYHPPPPPTLKNDSSIEVINEYITNAHLAKLFQEASVVVCPYIDATQSGVALTAYAFDKPVVTTNTGGLPEYVKHGETGLIVPPKDATALSDALVTILTDSSLRQSMETGIRRMRVGPLSWDSIGKQTLKIYEKTLDQHGIPTEGLYSGSVP